MTSVFFLYIICNPDARVLFLGNDSLRNGICTVAGGAKRTWGEAINGNDPPYLRRCRVGCYVRCDLRSCCLSDIANSPSPSSRTDDSFEAPSMRFIERAFE